MALSADLDRRVEAVRRFNRFYTRKSACWAKGCWTVLQPHPGPRSL
jgi:hypothetical protein